jgi:PAS domain S-box-containing protein
MTIPSHIRQIWQSGTGWTALSIIASIIVCGAVVALHVTTERQLGHVVDVITTFRQARIDLYQGMIDFRAAEVDNSATGLAQARALMAQAAQHIERAITRDVDGADQLRSRLRAFAGLMDEPTLQTGDTRKRLEQRAAFNEIQDAAIRLDADLLETLESLRGEQDRFFEAALTVSMGLLLLVTFGTIWSTRQRAAAMTSMRESEQRFRRLFDDAPLPLGFAGMDGRMIALNRRFTQVFGYDADDVPTIEAWWARAYPDPDHRAEVMAMWAARMTQSDGQPVHDDTREYRVRCKDGSERFMLVSGIGLSNGVLASFTDITERRQAERQLRDSQGQLAQAQKMEAIGQLTGGVAHDFNNLLAVITGNLELLQSRLGTDSASRRYVERATRAASRGADLTHRLLAFSRRQTLVPKRIDLNDLVVSSINLFSRTLGENIAIETHLAPDVDGVMVDPAQLENALLNLAVNARDAMPEGGRLVIETRLVELDMDYARRQADVAPGIYEMVSVTDTGEGMPPEIAARAFEPFFTTKDVGKGSGLGLSMVYGFAKQSGGHASIYSEPVQGTTVKIFLPRAESARPAHAMAPVDGDTTEYHGTGQRVLLVEDNPDVREIVESQLESLGYDVHTDRKSVV